MAKRYQLYHWNNLWIKTFVIVCFCLIKNDVYILFDKEKKYGVATFQLKKIENALHFEKLAVNPEAEGKGIGSYCIECIEKIAKSLGCVKICMEVYDKSAHAIEFYKKRQFNHVKKIKTRKYDLMVMEKLL